MSFPFYKQIDSNDCGPTCIKMLVKYFGKNASIQQLRELCNIDREGVSIKSIVYAAEKIGFDALALKATIQKYNTLTDIPVLEELEKPLICLWNDNHFVVVYKTKGEYAFIADPARGLKKITLQNLKEMLYVQRDYAKVIMLEPTEKFYNTDNPYFRQGNASLKLQFAKTYVLNLKKSIGFLFMLLLLQLAFQSLSPYLTQQSFDQGILKKNLPVIFTIVLVQVLAFALGTFFSYFISITSSHLAYKMSVLLTSDFLSRFARLPLSYFQTKKTSDFIQRFYDLSKLESFLTYNMAQSLLNALSVLILSVLLLWYSVLAGVIFLFCSVLYLFWMLYSNRRKREIDATKFDLQVLNHNNMNEFIEGINDIRLSGRYASRIATFMNIEKRRFENDLSHVKISQFYSIGSTFINTLSVQSITLYTSYLAISNVISIGQLAAIQLIVSQLNGSVNSLFGTMLNFQDVNFSLERLMELQSIQEEKTGQIELSDLQKIELLQIDFRYSDLGEKVIHQLSLSIPAGKTTAIVGKSGGGKTTLLKLILGILEPHSGNIKINGIDMKMLNMDTWRRKCGVILQDSFIFTDTIKNNVTEWDEEMDEERYIRALKQAAIYDFVTSLPAGHKTIIGRTGLQLSSGQKQRILIAKLFYRNPEIIFLDEATNNLDSETEKHILDHMESAFSKKTKLIVAHRLNTVINADHIIVLKQGEIIESGTHQSLMKLNSYYSTLIHEQILHEKLNL